MITSFEIYAEILNREEDFYFLPRQQALGASGIGLIDTDGFLNNPAASSIFNQYYFNMYYLNFRIEGVDFIGVNSLVPINKSNLLAFDFSDMGTENSTLLYTENKIGLTYINKLFKNLTLGIRGYYHLLNTRDKENILNTDNIAGRAFSYNIGLLYSPVPDLNIGFVIKRPGSEIMHFNDITDRKVASSFIGTGISYKYKNMLFYTELSDQISQGVEYTVFNKFHIRFGVSKEFVKGSSFNFSGGFGIEYKNFKINYAYKHNSYLPDLHIFSISSFILKQAGVIDIKKSFIRPLFASEYKHYFNYPPAYIIVKNKSSADIKFRVGIKINGIMKNYTFTDKWHILPSKGIKKLDIALNLPANIVYLQNTFNTTADFLVEYIYSDKNYTVNDEKNVIIYGGRYIKWDDIRKLGSFITPIDSTVIKFIDKLKNSNIDSKDFAFVNPNIKNAMLIYSGLQLLNMKYFNDPNIPDISKDNSSLDYIQYPGETFRKKSGDCDDLVALFASCLETAGINSAIISIPGHIFVALNTQVNISDMKSLSLKPDEFIRIDSTLWIPLELTHIEDAPFYRAWQIGAQLYREYKMKDMIEVIKTQDAWQVYPPNVNFQNSIIFDLSSEKLKQYFYNNFQSFYESRLNMISASLNNKFAKKYIYFNNVGAYLAQMGFINEAIDYFKKSISIKKNYKEAYVNLGNSFISLNMPDESIKYLKMGLKYNNSSELYLLLAISYAIKNDISTAQLYFNKAVKIEPSKRGKYEEIFRHYIP